jgi:dimethylaniline monooxygenase (N-oxide forming)
MSPTALNKWKLTAQMPEGEKQDQEFDFVVLIAIGMCSTPVTTNNIQGIGKFQGDVCHSAQFKDDSVAKGNIVVVVGGGKLAVDNSVSAASAGASSTTLLFREAHWPVPRKLLNLIPFRWGTYSRFGHFMLHRHHDMDPTSKLVHTVASPIKWAWWRIVETMFRIQFSLSKAMVPHTPIEVDLFNGGQILTYEFRDRLQAGGIDAKKGEIASFTETAVVLKNGTEIQTDLVVFGIGFTKSYNYFGPNEIAQLEMEKDGLWLYRNIVPPKLPGVAFIGAEVSTFNNILTQALQSKWLAGLLSGKIGLPSVEEMEIAIEKEHAWKRSWMPEKAARACAYQLHMPVYHDRLCKEMGENHLRKGWNFLAELFSPYKATDYSMIFEN